MVILFTPTFLVGYGGDTERVGRVVGLTVLWGVVYDWGVRQDRFYFFLGDCGGFFQGYAGYSYESF